MLLVLRDQAFEKIAQIESDIGIGVLLNYERTGSVLHEDRQKPACHPLFREPAFDLPRERIESLAARAYCNTRAANQVSVLPNRVAQAE